MATAPIVPNFPQWDFVLNDTDEVLIKDGARNAALKYFGEQLGVMTASINEDIEAISDAYYGPLAEDPAEKPSGNPSEAGDRYFNTALGVEKSFNGTAWQANEVGAHLADPDPHSQYEFRVMHNTTATRTPNASDDSAAGYAPRSTWFDTSLTPPEAYRCIDAAEGAAKWVKTSLTLDELGSAASSDVADFDPAGAAQSAQNHAVQRANHSGTQPLSTISDAGTAAAKNTGTGAGDLPTRSETDALYGPIGSYIAVQTNLAGAEEPDPARFIKLTAGEDGVGEYNEGKLISETITGSAPLLIATAVIDDASSPMNGETVHLINTENRFIAPGENAGAVANDQMQQITGEINQTPRVTSGAAGAFSIDGIGSAADGGGPDSRYAIVYFDSANSPGARTGDHTNVKRIITTWYQRYK